MDAVAVAGKGGVAKQQHGVGQHLAAGRVWPLRGGICWAQGGAGSRSVDDIPPLGQYRPVGARDGVFHRDEHEFPGAAALRFHGPQGTHPFKRLIKRQGAWNSTCPPAHIRRGRCPTGGRKPPRAGCPSGPSPCGRLPFLEQQPVHKRRRTHEAHSQSGRPAAPAPPAAGCRWRGRCGRSRPRRLAFLTPRAGTAGRLQVPPLRDSG